MERVERSEGWLVGRDDRGSIGEGVVGASQLIARDR